MATELLEQYGNSITGLELIPSGGGVYEVMKNGKLIFSKIKEERFPELDLMLVESGGDNLAASFSPELVDLCIYVIDVAAGDKIPRKGGPGITRSDLLVINKIDLAERVGADLEVMSRDTSRMRGDQPWCFTNLRTGEGIEKILDFLFNQLPNQKTK